MQCVVTSACPDNPLPHFVDPLTNERVTRPAISPHGFVMGYDTWCTTLRRTPQNTCPFTKQRVSRRQLVKLTWENIDQYRDKIMNDAT